MRSSWQRFKQERDRLKLVSHLQWTYGSALRYFKDNYNEGIEFIPIDTDPTIWLSSALTNDPVWLSDEETNAPVWVNSANGQIIRVNIIGIYIPIALADNLTLYDRFIADLHTVILKGVNYKIIVYENV